MGRYFAVKLFQFTYPRLEDIVITRFTIQLSLMFIDCGRVQRFAAGFTFNTFLVEWSSVNGHERLFQRAFIKLNISFIFKF